MVWRVSKDRGGKMLFLNGQALARIPTSADGRLIHTEANIFTRVTGLDLTRHSLIVDYESIVSSRNAGSNQHVGVD